MSVRDPGCAVKVTLLQLIRAHRYEDMHRLAEEYSNFESVAPLLAALEASA